MNRNTFVAVLIVGTVLPATCRLATVAAEQRSPPGPISLDGTWGVLFDPENKGREAGWHRDETFSSMAGRRDIEVPSCWELIEKDYEGVAFYRRTFMVRQAGKGKSFVCTSTQ